MPGIEANLTSIQLASIFQWFHDNKSVKDVHHLVTEHFCNMSIRSIYNYRNKWEASGATRTSDRAVVWEEIQTNPPFGITAGHLPVLRDTAAWATSVFGVLFNVTPTYRSLKWQSYILSYAPSIRQPVDIWAFGERFSLREFVSDFMRRPMEKADIDAQLSFKPWEDTDKENRYLVAVQQGLVPELPSRDEIGSSLKGEFGFFASDGYSELFLEWANKNNLALNIDQNLLCKPIMVSLMTDLTVDKKHMLVSQQADGFYHKGEKLPGIRICGDDSIGSLFRFSEVFRTY